MRDLYIGELLIGERSFLIMISEDEEYCKFRSSILCQYLRDLWRSIKVGKVNRSKFLDLVSEKVNKNGLSMEVFVILEEVLFGFDDEDSLSSEMTSRVRVVKEGKFLYSELINIEL